MIDIFYMHLPKTGGSTIEAYFKSHFGDQFLSHCEHLINSDRKDELLKYKVVSGHVPYRRIKSLDLPYATLVTSIRHPFDQLISHIRWLYYIGQDTSQQLFKSHPENIQKIAIEINELDFIDKEAVSDYFSVWNANLSLFDNMMTRYFTLIRIRGEVEEKHLVSALTGAAEIKNVVRLENLEEDLSRFFKVQDLEIKAKEIHKNRSGALLSAQVLENLSETLLPRYKFDMELYQFLLERSGFPSKDTQ